MTGSADRAHGRRPRAFRTIALAALIALLAVIPVFLTIAAVAPPSSAPMFGDQSSAAALTLGAVAVVGLLVMPFMGAVGRVGAVLMAVPAAVLAIARAIAEKPSEGPATGSAPLDIVLMVMIPAGYFMVLFGALRAARWSHIGSRVVAVCAVLLAAMPIVVPTGGLTDVEIAQRVVPHTLIIVGAVVAIVAVVIETVRHSAARRAAV